MKIAIVYDRVNKFGGAERVLLTLHEMFPTAPLYTSVYDPKNAKWAEDFCEVRTSFLQKIPYFRKRHEMIPFLMPLAFASLNLKDFDLVITVTSEFAKGIRTNGRHICYCLTPTRYLWSGYDEYFSNRLVRFATKPLVYFLREVDKKAAQKPDQIIAISSEVQRRIKKYYKRKSKIIFPPVGEVQTLKIRSFGPRGGVASHSFLKSLNNYYLMVSRLVKYKKVDLAIRAFNKLGFTLVIVGTGREEKKLRRMARENIIFLGNISDQNLSEIYKNAKALIFPQDEDFGITAVEAQSFGIPLIAYKKGGSLDTVIPNQTGVFFEKQRTEDLISAIKKFEKLKFNKKVIMKNAERFSKERFMEEFLHVIKNI